MTFIIGTPFSSNAGYYWNDDSASGGKKEEADIQTCPHCQATIKMQEWRRVEDGSMNGGYCIKCSKPICKACNKLLAIEGCIPFMSKIDKEFDAIVKFSQFLKDAGLEPASARPLFTGLITE
jgi:Zn ribbon nucleic-acid-binding protein